MGIVLECIRGLYANRDVLVGFAPANVLYSQSFSGVLNERGGRGYQRRLNAQQSLDFRRYIQLDGSTTIPLTFSLRPSTDGAWRVIDAGVSLARLKFIDGAGKLMAQVDCQHWKTTVNLIRNVRKHARLKIVANG